MTVNTFDPRRSAGALRPHSGFLSKEFLLLIAIVAFSSVRSLAVKPWSIVINTNNLIVVTNTPYNAIGDAVSDNAVAISNAIVTASHGGRTNGLIGGTVEIPAPGIFLCGPLQLANNVNIQVDAGAALRMLPMGSYPLGPGNTNPPAFLLGSSVTNIAITGPGAIDGQGAPWWPGAKTNFRPVMISLSKCNFQLIRNITLSNSPEFHIAIGSSRGNATVDGVIVRAPSSDDPVNPSHNTDACDVSGTNVLVENCNISTGDDDFTCGGSTSDVLLTNNTYGAGHGISIGSFTDKGGVSNITVINCTISGADNGIRIKSDRTKGGLVQNISYVNIGITNVNFPIQIYSYYDEVGTPSSISPFTAATTPVDDITNTTPIYRNINFTNITATSTSGFPIGIIWARTEMPATNITFNNVHITGDESFDLYNVYNAQFVNCSFTVNARSNIFALFDGNAVITNNPPTNTLFTFTGLTTNGYASTMSLYSARGALSNTNVLDSGPLTLADSTFTVSNSLSLAPDTVLNFTLSTNTTRLAVVGNLTLGGTNNISAGAGFTNGTYTLMTYTGTLSGTAPMLGSTPPNFSYAFNTGTPGQVNLIVSPFNNLPPTAPNNLTAFVTNGVVNLNWSSVATASGYNLKRATISGGPYTTIAPGLTSTSFLDTLVTNFTTYFYVVSATNSAGESANSTEISVMPLPSSVTVTTNVFSDEFSSSTLNSPSPTPPGMNNSSYELISSKTWSPTPSIVAGDLKFGIGATTSGSIQAQAQFAASPATLATVGDILTLGVTFTDTSGILTQAGTLGFGLYKSGGSTPAPGGLNGTATTNSSSAAANNTQLWVGYAGQIGFTGSDSRIMTRPAQTSGILFNNDQDLVTSGSGSSSYNNPTGVTVGTASSSQSVTLAAGSIYTETLAITLVASNTLGITNTLYSGSDTNGAVLSQFGGVASGSTFLTNSFDALAIGWRATANTSPTTIDISQIVVSVTHTSTFTPSLTPINITYQLVSNRLNLSWPGDHFGWRLQYDTNLNDTNWLTVPNSTNVISTNITIDPGNSSLFFRMTYP